MTRQIPHRERDSVLHPDWVLEPLSFDLWGSCGDGSPALTISHEPPELPKPFGILGGMWQLYL